MMDLAEIRKKARTQSSTQRDNLAPRNTLLPVQIETPGHPSVSKVTDNFWSEIGTRQFTTEEEYAQGLTDSASDAAAEQVQWLGFFLGKEEYALDIEAVSELIKPRVLTELPHVPNYICGIITLRGEVIPVVDLAARLGLQYEDHGDLDSQRVIICEGKAQRVGLKVDRISQVVRLATDEIEKPQLVSDNPATAFILGIGRKRGRMLIQLHPEKIIEIEEGSSL